MKRVLIVESINDDITKNRHNILSRSPRFNEYIVDFCYSLDWDENEIYFSTTDALKKHPLIEDDLLSKLKSSIKNFRPDYVLLHTGFVFRSHQEVFFRVLKKLKSEFEYIGFGIQERPGLEVDKRVFNNSKEVISLRNLFFREMLG